MEFRNSSAPTGVDIAGRVAAYAVEMARYGFAGGASPAPTNVDIRDGVRAYA